MNLYEIDQRIASLVDPETGELLDFKAFAALQMEWEQKIENMALWVKDLAAEAKAIKEEADRLTERRRSAENKAERLKSYLDRELDGEKFSTPRCAVTFRKTSSVEVDDPEAFIQWAEQNGYSECLRYKNPEVSKSGIAALMKTGASVPFVRLASGRSLGVK